MALFSCLLSGLTLLWHQSAFFWVSVPVVVTVECAIVSCRYAVVNVICIHLQGRKRSLRGRPTVENSILNFQFENWKAQFWSRIDCFQGKSYRVNSWHLKLLHPFFVRMKSLLDCSWHLRRICCTVHGI